MRFRSLSDWLGWLEKNHPKEIDLGLERVARVAASMGLNVPEAKTVSVAGTNGKGSCVAVLEQLLLDAGECVGVYTSPHFIDYCERIRVNGQPVGDAEVCAAFERIDAARGDISLTYFEFGTLAALDVFRMRGVSVQVLEVGLGGRLDAVNLVNADVAVVTSIAIDHEDWLGSDREVIGREKAGIFRTGKPAISADAEPPASIAQVANELGAQLLQVGRHWQASTLTGSWSFRGRTCAGEECSLVDLPLPHLPLPSTAAALQAMLALGFSLDDAGLRHCLSSIALPGRYQQVFHNGRTLVLDVAHNPAAAAYLARRLQADPVSGKTRAVLAMMVDKDRRSSLKALCGSVDDCLVAGLPHIPRAASTASLMEDFNTLGIQARAYETVSDALRAALDESDNGDRVLVAGSFFTVSEALKFMDQEQTMNSDEREGTHG